jgi:hypothetical protein
MAAQDALIDEPIPGAERSYVAPVGVVAESAGNGRANEIRAKRRTGGVLTRLQETKRRWGSQGTNTSGS